MRPPSPPLKPLPLSGFVRVSACSVYGTLLNCLRSSGVLARAVRLASCFHFGGPSFFMCLLPSCIAPLFLGVRLRCGVHRDFKNENVSEFLTILLEGVDPSHLPVGASPWFRAARMFKHHTRAHTHTHTPIAQHAHERTDTHTQAASAQRQGPGTPPCSLTSNCHGHGSLLGLASTWGMVWHTDNV